MEKDVKKILTQHLELDAFYTGDFSMRAPRSAVSPQPSLLPDDAMAKKTVKPKTPNSDPPDSAAGPIAALETLDDIAAVVRQCQRCRLGSTRTHAVPGQGNPKARLVFIGEGPGADEDAQGLAFVGRAGKLLTDMITAMGLTRDEVFIGNIVKCRPPENRDPLPDEIRSCRPYLKRQLELIAPEVIVALGAHAARTLLQSDEPIGKLRGQFFDYRFSETSLPAKLMPTYHPAYLLRNYSVDNRRRVWEDMQKVMKELGLTPPKKKT